MNNTNNSIKRIKSLTGLAKGLKTFYQRFCVLACIIFYTIIMTTSSPALAATLVTNTATANFSINGTSNQLSHSVQFTKDTVVIPTDTITLSKQADVSNVFTGDTVAYTLQVANPNNNIQNSLTILDILPDNLSYQTGSATLNGTVLNPSQVNLSGTQLLLTLGDIPANTIWTVKYSVVVSASGTAINRATAKTDSAVSSEAQAPIDITLRTPSIIKFLKINDAGVNSIIPTTSYDDDQTGGTNWQDINSVTLPNGTIINLPTLQPLIDATQYTLLDPIVIEVTDLDQNVDDSVIDTIIVTVDVPGTGDTEVLLLKETTPNSGIFRGVLITTTDSTNIQNGLLSLKDDSTINVTYHDETDSTDTKADVALVVPDNKISLAKIADKSTATIGELVRYSLTFRNTTNFSIPTVQLIDTLPLGFKYVQNTASLNGTPLNIGVLSSGRKLNFNLSNMPVDTTWRLEYLTKITAGVQIGNAVNTAYIDSNNFKSAKAQATVVIKDDLLRSRNILTGRVYIGCATGKNAKVLKDARIFMETGRSVLSDEEGFWHMEGVQAGTHTLQVDEISLPSAYKPIICQGNTRYAGNARSQFVNLQAGSLWQVDFHVQKQAGLSGNDKQKTVTLKKLKIEKINPLVLYGKEYLETAAEGFEILWPKNNYVPAVASTKILIKSSPQYKVEAFLNGEKVSPLNYDGSSTNKKRTVTIRRWKGVDINIKNRNNTLLVILKDKSGKEIARRRHNIHFSGEATSAEFLAEESILVADGKTIPVIALRPKDKDGFRLRTGTHGYFSLDNSQFQVKSLSETKDTLILNESLAGTYKYHVEEDGIARIRLNPTTQSGEVSLKVKFPDSKSKIIKAWLKPKLRKWILVGLAEGTLAHNKLSGNMKSLEALDKADTFSKRGRVAFYAQGKVKGKYLLTVAYDTHKAKQEVGSQLNGNIDPDAWYTIYGDNSNNQYNAPSSRKLYLKIEKDNFYALFGDYNTNMNITELAKYERVLNGIKSEYKGEKYSYNAFISETSSKHHHREIPGDGTSGLYHLTSNIIANSETIKIETRDRFHSEQIIESRILTRYQDYEIDYEDGTLFFKFPVTGRDDNFNPQLIIVDYDSEENSNKETVVGGRVAVKTDNAKLEVGLSTIVVNRDNAKNDSLIALDANYNLTTDTKLHIEVAQSKTAKSGFKSTNAEIIELEKEIADMEARVYYRNQGENFGVIEQASESGTKKIGADLSYKVNDKISVNAEVSNQTNLSDNNKRQLIEVGIKHQHNQLELNGGIRHSKETIVNNTVSNNTVIVGGRYTTKNGKLSFRTNIEENINSSNTTERSPNRKIIGIDLKINKDTTAFAEYELTDSGKEKTQSSRIGLTKSLWKGAKARTAYTKEISHNGIHDYASVGLTQRLQVTEHLHTDITIDHAKTLNSTQNRFNDDEPSLQGAQQDDYTAFSIGLGSHIKDWDWTSRFEFRKGDLIDKINFHYGLIHKIKNGKQVSANFHYTESENSHGEYDKSSKISFGAAWHPKEKNYVFFNRLDLIDEKTNKNGPAGNNSHTQKIIHNMHYNRKIKSKTQLSVHHGIKHVIDENKQEKYNTTIDTGTVEIRHDINKKWDIGARVGYLRDWKGKTTEAVAGISLGMTPAKNAWIELGYNFEGFNDEDFDSNNFKQKGAYTSFRYKFDQGSFDGKDLPVRRLPKDEERKQSKTTSSKP